MWRVRFRVLLVSSVMTAIEIAAACISVAAEATAPTTPLMETVKGL
jgi:hypothetical protein